MVIRIGSISEIASQYLLTSFLNKSALSDDSSFNVSFENIRDENIDSVNDNG